MASTFNCLETGCSAIRKIIADNGFHTVNNSGYSRWVEIIRLDEMDIRHSL